MKALRTTLTILIFCYASLLEAQVTSIKPGTPCYDLLKDYRYESVINCLKSSLNSSDLSEDERAAAQVAIAHLYLEIMQPYQAIDWVNKVDQSPQKKLILGHAYFLLNELDRAGSNYRSVVRNKEEQNRHLVAAAYLMLNTLQERRIEEQSETVSIWRIKEPEGVDEMRERQGVSYQGFLDHLDSWVTMESEHNTPIPFSILMDCTFAPRVNLTEANEQLTELISSVLSKGAAIFLGQFLTEVQGEETLHPDYTTPESWPRTRYNIAIDSLKEIPGWDMTLALIYIRRGGFFERLSEDIRQVMLRSSSDDLNESASRQAGLQRYLLRALESYQEVLNITTRGFGTQNMDVNPNIAGWQANDMDTHLKSRAYFKRALQYKARILHEAFLYSRTDQGKSGLRLKALQYVFETIMLTDQFIDLMFDTFESDKDKYFYAGYTKDDRLFAIDFCFLRFGLQPRDKMLHSGFYKMAIALVDDEQLNLAYEREKTDVFTKPGDIIDAILNGYRIDKSADSTYLHVAYYFAEKTKAYSLLTSISQSKAGIDFSRDDFKVRGLSQVQNSLDEKTSVIEFIFSDQFLYRFGIMKDYFTVVKLRRKTEEDVAKEVKAIRNGILFYQDEAYAENGYSLYKKLFPSFGKKIENLVIIPDGLMYMVPFEALLTKKTASSKQAKYDQYSYLIKDYNVSYSFSGTLYLLNKEEQENQPDQEGFIGFAPVFADGVEAKEASVRGFDSLIQDRKRAILQNGTYVSPLPGTEAEVNVIGAFLSEQNIKADLLVNDQANEASFKAADLAGYKYLHIATHGFVNTEDPEKSGLMFYPMENSSEDGILYGNEIYEMDINADLVTLSACETGLGKVVSGEGLIGLSRALQFAGARNQLVSMWKVSDNSTSQMMRNFYSHLIKNPDDSYSKALTTVKRQLIFSPDYSHPYFWSPFILIGR